VNFPASPTVGQQSVQNGRTYAWTGYAWEIVPNAITISSSQVSDFSSAVAASLAGDKGDIVVSTGGSSWSIDSGVLSSFGRSLVDDADAAAARTTLGLAAVASSGSYSDLTGTPSTFTPASHTHSADAIVSGALDIARIPTGTTSTTVCVGNDSRLSDAREWSAATVTQADAEAGVATSRVAWTVQRVWQAIAAWWAASADKSKLDGIASGATANATDAQLRDRATHTGTQAISTVDGLQTALDGKAATSHTHGNITNAGAIGSTANLPLITTTSGVVTTGTFGTTASTFCQGNDSRLSNTRTPTDNTVTTAKIVNDAVTYAKIQNVTATDRLLGRSTAGAGDVEEITCTAFGRSLIDDADASAGRTTLGLVAIASSGSGSDITSGTVAYARLPVGTTTSTVCAGDDARLSDARTPTDGSVSTAKLADDAVTYAKLQNVSVTDRLLGRATAGAGDVEEIACTAFGRSILDDADAAAGRTTLGAAAASHTHSAADVTSGSFDIARIPTGTTSTTVCIGNDSRLSDARTPLSHTHGNITNAGAIGSTANLPLITATSGVVTTGSFGSAANTFCVGNDARLSDTRTPTDGSVTTAKLADDAVTYAKLQNVSGTDRILGRSSAGAGDVEEITCTAFGRSLLDDADAAAARTTIAAAPTASPTFTGVVTVAAGSASAPAITSTGDTDTGLYYTTDTVNVSSGGVRVARFDSSSFAVFNRTVSQNAFTSLVTNAPGGEWIYSYLTLQRTGSAAAVGQNFGVIEFIGQDTGGTSRVAGSIVGYASAAAGSTFVNGSLYLTASDSSGTTIRHDWGHDGSQRTTIGGISQATRYPAYYCRSWGNINGTASTPSLRAGENVASITDNGTGDVTITLSAAMPDANYAVVASAKSANNTTRTNTNIHPISLTADSFRLQTQNGSTATDCDNIFFAIVR